MTHFPPVFALPPPAAPALPASVANSSYPARLMACLEKIQLYSAPQPTGFPRLLRISTMRYPGGLQCSHLALPIQQIALYLSISHPSMETPYPVAARKKAKRQRVSPCSPVPVSLPATVRLAEDSSLAARQARAMAGQASRRRLPL